MKAILNKFDKKIFISKILKEEKEIRAYLDFKGLKDLDIRERNLHKKNVILGVLEKYDFDFFVSSDYLLLKYKEVIEDEEKSLGSRKLSKKELIQFELDFFNSENKIKMIKLMLQEGKKSFFNHIRNVYLGMDLDKKEFFNNFQDLKREFYIHFLTKKEERSKLNWQDLIFLREALPEETSMKIMDNFYKYKMYQELEDNPNFYLEKEISLMILEFYRVKSSEDRKHLKDFMKVKVQENEGKTLKGCIEKGIKDLNDILKHVDIEEVKKEKEVLKRFSKEES